MIGLTISHYRILEKIGSGGMGEVYKAEDTKLKRQVALKFLPRQLTADAEAKERFEREAQAAASLNHPNIVTIHEIGEHEGQTYIAMEYVEGRTLKELISASVGAGPRACPDTGAPDVGARPHAGTGRAVPLPVNDVLAITVQIASGLSAAHAKGIVHRDIKPQNIVIGPNGQVKILDFGLAKLKGASPLTKESFAYGTVHYMSPEQGLGREVDARSDIWSLGVVLHEMLTGAHPFKGDYEQAVIYAIVNEELALPQAGLPAGLEAVLRRCLAKKRQERYQTADELAADLRRRLAGKEFTEVISRSAGRPRAPFRWRRPGRIAAMLLAGAALVAALLLVPGARRLLKRGLGMSGVPRTRHMAVLPFAAAGSEARPLADGFMALIAEKLTQLEAFHDGLWTVPAAEILADRGKSAQFLQRLWGCSLFVSGELREQNNSLRLRLRLLDARQGRELKRVELQGHAGNLSVFQDGLLARLCELLDIQNDERASKEINAGGTAMPGAFVLYLKGKGLAQDSARPDALASGVALLEKALRQDGGYTQARLALADALRRRFRLGRDPLDLQRAMELGELAKREAGPWTATQLAWAMLLSDNGEKISAEGVLQEILRRNERCYPACIELARICAATGKTNEAERHFKRAIDIRPGYPAALYSLGYFYKQNGRIDEALSLYQRLAELAPGDYTTFNNMAVIYVMKEDRAKAIAMLERSLAIQPSIQAQSNLATLYFYMGSYRKSLPLFLEVAEKSGDCRGWGNLADTYRQLPEFQDQAAAAYRRAIALATSALGKNPEDFELLSVLALYYAHSQEKWKAMEAIVRARGLARGDLETIRRAILVYEAVGERRLALDALREFRERLGRVEEIEKEPDLAGLRRDAEYLELVREAK